MAAQYVLVLAVWVTSCEHMGLMIRSWWTVTLWSVPEKEKHVLFSIYLALFSVRHHRPIIPSRFTYSPFVSNFRLFSYLLFYICFCIVCSLLFKPSSFCHGERDENNVKWWNVCGRRMTQSKFQYVCCFNVTFLFVRFFLVYNSWHLFVVLNCS